MVFQTHPIRARVIALLAFLFVFISLVYSTGIIYADDFEQTIAVSSTIIISSVFHKKYTKDFLNSVGRGVYYFGLWRWFRRTIAVTIIIFPFIYFVIFGIMTYLFGPQDGSREYIFQMTLNMLPIIGIVSIFIGIYAATSYSLDRPLIVLAITPLLLFLAALIGNILSIALSNPMLFISNISSIDSLLSFNSEVQNRVRISAAAAVLVVGIQTIIWPEWEKSAYDREQERLPVRIPIDSFINEDLLSDINSIIVEYNNKVRPLGYRKRFPDDPPYDVTEIEPVVGMTHKEILEVTDAEKRKDWSEIYETAIRETRYEWGGGKATYLELKVIREEKEQNSWNDQIIRKLKEIISKIKRKEWL